ncbi:MAG: polysaccharide biosynthesis/export family protein [Pyrinomonadaceae bacterium]
MRKALIVAVAIAALASFNFNADGCFAHAQIKDARSSSAREAISGTSLPSEDKKSEAGKSPDKSSAGKTVAMNAAPGVGTENIPAATVNSISDSPAPVSKKAHAGESAGSSAPSALRAGSALALSGIYRVGTGDVLDIRLLNSPSRESTLFTVLADGIVDYPLAGEPLNVNGLTPEEIAAQLTSKIKIFEKAQFAVSVRDYASHNVIVTGLVVNPGTRTLRREATPLYVVLAEAQPRAEAVRATIARAGAQLAAIDLNDHTAMSTLILPGDFIKVIGAPPPAPLFYFIGGQVGAPGQKDFHAGLTLTQAVLASGGTTPLAASKVKVSRQGADGLLKAFEYNLKQIGEGKIPDPQLQPGDRIEVGRGHW